MRVKIVGAKFNKNNDTFIKFDKVTTRIQVGRTKVNLTNLFNGKQYIYMNLQRENGRWKLEKKLKFCEVCEAFVLCKVQGKTTSKISF